MTCFMNTKGFITGHLFGRPSYYTCMYHPLSLFPYSPRLFPSSTICCYCVATYCWECHSMERKIESEIEHWTLMVWALFVCSSRIIERGRKNSMESRWTCSYIFPSFNKVAFLFISTLKFRPCFVCSTSITPFHILLSWGKSILCLSILLSFSHLL